VDWFLGSKVKDEVMKIMPVQKQTRAGQRTRFKAFVIVGDADGHVGLGVNAQRKLLLPFEGPLFLLSSLLFPYEEDTGVTRSVLPTLFLPRLLESAAQSA